MVLGRRNIEIACEIRDIERKLRWLRLKPFKSAEDRERIAALEDELMWLRRDNLTQY